MPTPDLVLKYVSGSDYEKEYFIYACMCGYYKSFQCFVYAKLLSNLHDGLQGPQDAG